VTLENDVLTIEAQVDDVSFDKHNITYTEYGVGDYYRAFTLNEAVDRDKIEARMKNGVLSIVLPKAEAVKTTSIPIKG
jgi:HSP20 family protein